MSRLIVKNLPKNISETKLREVFGVAGTITDVQLKYTSEGKFRQFAFIGYHNENDAQQAVNQFHNSHIKTNKIQVEICVTLGDENKPKAWSKYAKDSSAYKEIHGEKTPKPIPEVQEPQISSQLKLLEKYKDDPNFEEFMKLNNSKDAQLLLKCRENENIDEEKKLASQEVSDTDYMKSLIKKPEKEQPEPKIPLYTLKLRNLPYNCKKKDVKDFFRDIPPFSIRLPRKIKGICYVGFKSEKRFKKALLKDKSFINGKQILVASYDSPNAQTSEAANPVKMKWKSQEESLKHEEEIAESGRIFIRNLSYTCTEDDIHEQFAKYGPITEINLPIDSATRKLKGFGIVTFLMPEHAVRAYSALDGSIIRGRMLHLLPGKAKKEDETRNEAESTNYKQKKAAKLKAQSGQSHNWNSLFLGHDAVANVIAKTYGTSKETVLSVHGDSNAAVRLALGETQIIAATKKYLEDQGVHLDAFNNVPTNRSKTVILVKNLPAETELIELRQLFGNYGVIGRIIFPPNGITAIIEFLEPSEARKAFTNLAYSKFKHTPLYLEWAPENSLKPHMTIKSVDTNEEVSENKSNIELEEPEQKNDEGEEEDPEPDTTLFVKNLNFKTTDAALRQHFESCGKIHYATVATKKDRNNPSNQLSMGYGFVRFIHKTSANNALKTLQGRILDDKALELKRSERTLQNDVRHSKKSVKVVKQTGTKILVRNVPFQAHYKELFDLFKTFGEIKALRLPQKMSVKHEHRGFAFVDYFINADAKKAFEALCQSTHLYGRRLVLEWASTEDQEVDEIRKRTAEHFNEHNPSVIVPIHNGEPYINRCFESILTQTALKILKVEVCVCDDASTDNTRNLLKQWYSTFERNNVPLSLYVNDGGHPLGVGFSKNRAVSISTGKYLCFQDIDDVMLPNRILSQYRRALQEPSDTIIGSKFKRMPKNSTPRYTNWANNVQDLKIQIYTSHGPTLIMPTWFCHRSVFNKINGFVEDGKGTPEDLIFFYKHLDLNGNLYRVDDYLVIYYYYPNATTFSIHEDTIWSLRLKQLEKNVLSNWSNFTIWNAGKQGRKFYNSLSNENKGKVIAMCDVNIKIIGKNYTPYNPKTKTFGCSVKIISFKDAIAPIIICVKMDLTNGDFERNLESLNLLEGKDYIFFS
ncbi:hypothetical protein FQR65_LT15002 [Abscondita terminalis]|nr:hypothetical protein FQR65_LT15002 [Abscondita terminalis]